MTDTVDPFKAFADEQQTHHARARERKAKTREEKRVTKAMIDRTILHRQWRDWHCKRVMKLQTGRYAEQVGMVADFLERMTIDDGERLISLVRRGPWRNVDADTRYLLLGLIAQRIMYIREAEGLSPFEDSIPFSDEEPTVFEIIREELLT